LSGAVALLSAVGFFGGEPGKRTIAACLFAICSAMFVVHLIDAIGGH